MSRLTTSRRTVPQLLLGAAVVVAACGGSQPQGSMPPAPTRPPSAAPSAPSATQTALSAEQICARIQVSAAQQATGDAWTKAETVGTPVSCDFTDAGDDRLSIATTTYPSKQIADMSWDVGFPGKPQVVRGLGRQAVFMTVEAVGGGTQGQLYVRVNDTSQYNVRLTSAKAGSSPRSLLDACTKVAQLLVSQ